MFLFFMQHMLQWIMIQNFRYEKLSKYIEKKFVKRMKFLSDFDRFLFTKEFQNVSVFSKKIYSVTVHDAHL